MAKNTFTNSLKKLQKNAEEIGRESTSLEDALKLFEQGIKEYEFCSEILENAEQKIEIYEEDTANVWWLWWIQKNNR